MHPGKALARLNAKNVRFDVGTGGGKSELNPVDIAGALAFVPAGLGRELLCRVWWPDGARLTAEHLDAKLASMQISEWSRREDALQTAMATYAVASSEFARRRGEAMFQQAQSFRWPRLVLSREPLVVAETYGRIRQAVLGELAAVNLCTACTGYGAVLDGGKVVECMHCSGAGHQRPSDRARAEACGLKAHSEYQRKWRPVYEWLMERCADALREAEHAFRRVLE